MSSTVVYLLQLPGGIGFLKAFSVNFAYISIITPQLLAPLKRSSAGAMECVELAIARVVR